MKRYFVIAALLSCVATPSHAGLNEGIAAAAAGNYAQAAAEFEPLASAGDAAAQYYLAKLYLEGHGPSNDVPRGVDLMTEAANNGYPEAQAQLGLMYAMGLGVKVDNALAYDWLSKSIAALPDGTRRQVATANRDAVLQRMTPTQRSAAAAGAPLPEGEPEVEATPVAEAEPEPTPEPTPEPAPEPTQEAAAAPTPAPAATETVAAPEPTPAPAPAPAPEAAAEPAAATTDAPPPVASAQAAPAEEPAAPEQTAAVTVESEPEQSSSVEVPLDQPASAPPAQTASTEQVKAGIRIQMASLPNEEAAWNEWKRISQEFKDQVGDLTAAVETADLGQKGVFYRLQAGPFETVAAAKDRCGKLKEAGLDCLVVGKQ